MKYYDINSKGFYLRQNESKDRIEITDEYWRELLNLQSLGQEITSDGSGNVIAVLKELTDKEQKECRLQELQNKLTETDYVIVKLYELKITDNSNYDTEFERYKTIIKQRNEWREEANKIMAELNDFVG